MNLAALSTTQIIVVIAVAAVVVLAIVGIALSIRKRRTEKLRTRFGNAEYTRAVTEGGSQRKA
jgi:signal transduction histidine kinase